MNNDRFNYFSLFINAHMGSHLHRGLNPCELVSIYSSYPYRTIIVYFSNSFIFGKISDADIVYYYKLFNNGDYRLIEASIVASIVCIFI